MKLSKIYQVLIKLIWQLQSFIDISKISEIENFSSLNNHIVFYIV